MTASQANDTGGLGILIFMMLVAVTSALAELWNRRAFITLKCPLCGATRNLKKEWVSWTVAHHTPSEVLNLSRRCGGEDERFKYHKQGCNAELAVVYFNHPFVVKQMQTALRMKGDAELAKLKAEALDLEKEALDQARKG